MSRPVSNTGLKLPLPARPRVSPLKSCPVCGSSDRREFFRSPDRLHGIPGDYIYRRCQSCRSVFQDPMVIPEDLALCYPTEYYTHVAPNGVQETQIHLRTGRGLARLRDEVRAMVKSNVTGVAEHGVVRIVGGALASFRRVRERAFFGLPDELIPRGGSLRRAIDVGCGSGFQMRELALAGWEVEGVEWDEAACETARRMTGCAVELGDFRELDLPLGTYELVVLRHVFEHISDPMSALLRVRDLLKPGGRAVLFYPNPESLGARVFGEHWFPWEAPRHLTFIPVKSLERLTEGAGMRLASVRTTARFASYFFACSRTIRRTNFLDLAKLKERLADRLLAHFERGLTALGVSAGEEIVALLERPKTT